MTVKTATRKATSKTTTLAEAVASATAEAIAAAEQTAADIEATTDALPGLEDAVFVAEDAPDAIVATWKAGDASIPAVRLVEAEAELKRAKVLLDGAEKRLERLRQRTPNTDTSIASIVQTILSKVAPRVPSHIAPTKLAWSPSDTTELPVLLVAQNGATEASPSGVLSGEAVATYFYDESLHRELTPEMIETAASELGMGVEAMTVNAGWEGRQTIRVRVQFGVNGTPRIPSLDQQGSAKLLMNFAGDVAGLVSKHAPSAVKSRDGRTVEALEGDWLRVTLLGDSLNESVSESGERTALVKLSIGIDVRKPFDGSLSDLLGQLVKDHEGILLPSLGLVSEADMRSIQHRNHPQAVEVEFKLSSLV